MIKESKTLKEKFVDIVNLLNNNQIVAVKFDKFMDRDELKMLEFDFDEVVFNDINKSKQGNLCIIDNVDLIYKDFIADEALYKELQEKEGKFLFLYRNGISRKIFTDKKSKFYGTKTYNFGCKSKEELIEQTEKLLRQYAIYDFTNDKIEKIINLADSKDFYITKIVKEIALVKEAKEFVKDIVYFAYENIYKENILKHEILVGKAKKTSYFMDILIALANDINPYNAIGMVAGNTAKYIAQLEANGLVDSELIGVSKFQYKIADPIFKSYLRTNFTQPKFKGYLLRQNERK